MEALGVEVVNNTSSGKCFQVESFGGQELMRVKKDQMYFGDIIASDVTEKYPRKKKQMTRNYLQDYANNVLWSLLF